MPAVQNKLVNDILESYDKKVKPTRLHQHSVSVTFSMDLYQIIEIVTLSTTFCTMHYACLQNEPQQYVLINAWIIEVG